MQTLLLDNSIDHWLLNEGTLTKRFLPEPVRICRTNYEPLPPAGSFDRLILTGSEASILDDDDWILRQMDFVSEAIAAGKPVLGICFGHQLLARALWGKETVGKSVTPEFGWQAVRLNTTDPLFSGLPPTIDAFCSHFDEVRNLPPKAEVLAVSDGSAVQAFRLREQPMWGLQFHPEIGIAAGMLLLTYFGSIKKKVKIDLVHAWRRAERPVFASRIFANFWEAGR